MMLDLPAIKRSVYPAPLPTQRCAMSTWLSYWWNIFQLTIDRIKDHWRAILFAYACLPVADIFHYYTSGRAKASQAFEAMTLTQIIPFTLGGVFLTIIYMVLIEPWRFHQTISAQIKHYENEASSKLRFVSGDTPPYRVCESQTKDGTIWRFRVQVQNAWHEQLTDCAVILEGITPLAGDKFIARRLKLATDNPPDTLNVPYKQSFSLAPHGGKELIDVCQVDMRPGANKIRLFIATEGHRDLHNNEFYIPKDNYIFTVKAEANRGQACGVSFALETDKAEPKFFPL